MEKKGEKMNGLTKIVGIMEIQRVLNKEGIEEVDEMDYCSECKELEVIYRSSICWNCFKRACDVLQKDEDRQDYNCRL